MIILKWLAVIMFAAALFGLGTLFITSDKGDVSPESPTQPSAPRRNPDRDCSPVFFDRAKQNYS
ncbi:hypothetical protein [Brucella anthropi]|uniref:hypothetical protein n=1 Tax=Brucella anthropi TaxID=529 RepID=UPI0005BB7D5C|nr:hypothetical protein [Brucella anthropi]KIU69433.1 hypothetical protein TR92_06055 [Brucella anthropi]